MSEDEIYERELEGQRRKELASLLYKTIKSIFVKRDWWKLSEDNNMTYECCECCAYMCPECGECHGKDNVSLRPAANDEDYLDFIESDTFEHFGIGCPHKGLTTPKES